MKVIQVVKRYGICGGMEEYAYRLVHELKSLGIDVSVLCETKINDPLNSNTLVIELNESRKKPRWWSHLQFAKKVKKWVTLNNCENTIIHSHERIDCHNITTIHSTLFNFPKKKALPSLRSSMNERIERNEICSPTVQAVIPVSEIISKQLRAKYPPCLKSLNAPICPGVSDIKIKKSPSNHDVPVIGFIGKEWKRKGLPKVIEIWREVRKEVPLSRLCLAGFPEDEEIGIKKDERRFVDVIGYIEEKENFYHQIDLLLHPAKKEAFGMVITEALSIGIPVVCSSECGASYHVPLDLCHHLFYNAPAQLWVKSILEILNKSKNERFPKFSRPWNNVAKEYLKVYQAISL